ncbi:hypothetical protein I3843_07G090200 [Carya illinoinensis]|uniref:Uncharacterized protein n=1 Tax=Carya illinoinensis TaxID=32201 RepID=A0A922EIN7_CARIL|nr:hypothetical protein I3760_07G090600 [Carya illinoinensis]KAG2697105.1 hypothetical protein I3760_07G090600 [Carya illinoinensis]KAG2697106.1 hypothetical protein I3760_07G090600 [Carya illinoinensis]KAG2697107.1 hypothetical protein I3760_07G090600 [Carya illinoinensis]KAG6703630.1 hypothetical protein I3842_07G094100 [Carya illinoinensis]
MGKKPKAAKNQEKEPMCKPERTSPPQERVTLQPGKINPSPERVGSQPNKGNPSPASMEIQSESSIPSLGRVKTQPKQQADLSKQSNPNKRVKFYASVVRRSERIRNAVMPAQNLDIEPIVEEIILSESEKEDDPPTQTQREQNQPEPTTFDEKNLEEKVEYILQQLEAQEKAMEALKSESSKADFSYKKLYIDSQKKVESLSEENKQLSMKLEIALGKLEAYENGNRVFSEVLEKLKDFILVSNLTKATETAFNASSQALRSTFCADDDALGSGSRAVKRNKTTSQNEKN